MSYLDEKVLDYLQKYKVKEFCYTIPIKELLSQNKHVPIGLEVMAMKQKATLEGLEIYPHIEYNNGNVIVYERGFFMLNKRVTFQIPYGERQKHIEFLLDLDSMVELDGMVAVFVSNNPYKLECYVVVHCLESFDTIKKLIQMRNLEITNEFGVYELLSDSAEKRMYDSVTLVKDKRKENKECVENLFLFQSIQELEEKGIKTSEKTTRRKVFVSYAWADSHIVRNFVEEIKDFGVNVFIDYKSIDHGENILQKISEGLEESDCFICFFSEAFKKSSMASKELLTIWKSIIYNDKKFFPVLLDKVVVDDIVYGIGEYKYFKYSNDMDELLQTAMEWINKQK